MRRFFSLLGSFLLLNFFLISPVYAGNTFSQSGAFVLTSNQWFSATNSGTLVLGSASNFTVEGWVRFNSTVEQAFLQNGDDNSCTNKNFQFYYDGASHLTFDLCASSGTTEKVGTVAWTPSTATWYHLAFAYDTGGNGNFYVNGILQGATVTGYPTTVNSRGAAVYKVGGYTASSVSGGISMNGNMQLWRVWTTNLSAATILANTCTVYAGGTTNLAAQWTLDNTLNDNSGNTHTLTAVGGASFSASNVAPCTTVAAAGGWGIINFFGWW